MQNKKKTKNGRNVGKICTNANNSTRFMCHLTRAVFYNGTYRIAINNTDNKTLFSKMP